MESVPTNPPAEHRPRLRDYASEADLERLARVLVELQLSAARRHAAAEQGDLERRRSREAPELAACKAEAES